MDKEKLRKIPHLISGVIILIHSWERFESGYSTWPVFFLAGIVFFSIALLHHKLSKKVPKIDMLFYIIEAILSFIIAHEFYAAGKQGLPAAYIIAGIIQLLAIFIFIKKNKNGYA